MNQLKTDILILGNSLHAISLAIQLGKSGKDVLLAELLDEYCIRSFYKIGKTALNDLPVEGKTFDNLMNDQLKKANVKSLCGLSIIDVAYNESNEIYTINGFDTRIEAREIVYSPTITADQGKAPLTTDKVDLLQWSACAWSDAYFFKGQKAGVYGNGSWAANQALNAFSDQNRVTIYNPEEQFIADDYLLDELKSKQIQIINNCKKFQLIEGSEKQLVAVEYEVDGIKKQDDCKIVYEGRVKNTPETYLDQLPQSDKISVYRAPLFVFDHEGEFQKGIFDREKEV